MHFVHFFSDFFYFSTRLLKFGNNSHIYHLKNGGFSFAQSLFNRFFDIIFTLPFVQFAQTIFTACSLCQKNDNLCYRRKIFFIFFRIFFFIRPICCPFPLFRHPFLRKTEKSERRKEVSERFRIPFSQRSRRYREKKPRQKTPPR